MLSARCLMLPVAWSYYCTLTYQLGTVKKKIIIIKVKRKNPQGEREFGRHFKLSNLNFALGQVIKYALPKIISACALERQFPSNLVCN